MADDNPYPGSKSEVDEVVKLAEAYYDAAMALFQNAPNRGPLSLAPARLCALHSIELFQNAFFRHRGEEPGQIRGRFHSLDDDEFARQLKLKKKTADHLVELTKRREYLVSRCGPEQASRHTELNRLQATLLEVRAKVKAHLSRGV